MTEKFRFLGLDVHAETIAVAVAEPNLTRSRMAGFNVITEVDQCRDIQLGGQLVTTVLVQNGAYQCYRITLYFGIYCLLIGYLILRATLFAPPSQSQKFPPESVQPTGANLLPGILENREYRGGFARSPITSLQLHRSFADRYPITIFRAWSLAPSNCPVSTACSLCVHV